MIFVILVLILVRTLILVLVLFRTRTRNRQTVAAVQTALRAVIVFYGILITVPFLPVPGAHRVFASFRLGAAASITYILTSA